MNMTILASIWPVTAEGWVTLITAVCTALVAIGALVPTLIKLFKSLKELVKNKQWKKILAIINDTAVSAEKTGKSGAEKKEIVIAAVVSFCKESGVEFTDDLSKQVSDAIDELIKVHNLLSK